MKMINDISLRISILQVIELKYRKNLYSMKMCLYGYKVYEM